jgi:hypothetical protein
MTNDLSVATPTVAGGYESYCVSCMRTMRDADKRCIVCTDCDQTAKKQSAPLSALRVSEKNDAT